MAMGNGAVWVFDGIMKDMSDDELAIVVGHELAHYTHEHSRRQMRKAVWGQMGSLAAILAAEAIDNDAARVATQLGSTLGFTAWMSGYGRDLEDQADRVGLRYAYEAGYDISRAPQVWQRFLEKYGEGDRVTNFFFSDHSLASARRKNLESEIRNNYSRPGA
jgi:Zn-dependent protease with chaperone function